MNVALARLVVSFLAMAMACTSGTSTKTLSGTGGKMDTGGGKTLVTTTGGATTIAGTGGAPMSSGGTTADDRTDGAVGPGGAGGAGTSTLPTGLPKDCESVCNAATPVYPQPTDDGTLGNVTMYTTSASSGGACLYGATKVMYFAAINVNQVPGDGKGQWQEGRICGQCVEATALTSQGPKQVVVRIMDRCPDESCGIDLGGSAPAAVMLDGFGRYQGAWRLISCAGHPEVFDGVPSLFVKEGSNPYWAAIQVRNPMTAVAAIDWQKQGDLSMKGSLALASPSIENYYTVPVEVLQASAMFDLTVRYGDGTTAHASLTSSQLGQPEGSYPLQ